LLTDKTIFRSIVLIENLLSTTTPQLEKNIAKTSGIDRPAIPQGLHFFFIQSTCFAI